MCAYSELYNEYDAFFGHCQPANPWLNNDTTMWESNQPIVENPTQLRVKRWSFSFWELISDKTGVKEFEKFCDSEFSTENLKFYLACQDVKKVPKSQMNDMIRGVFK